MRKLFALALTVGLFCFSAPVFTQEQTPQQPSAEELEKQKEEREKNAYRLLEQVIDEAQSLRLTENRVRIQINAADVLWPQNQGRARGLFTMAAEGVVELTRTPPPSPSQRFNEGNAFGNARPATAPNMRGFQLRQELVFTAARHDAALAYQLLAATKPPAPMQPSAEQPNARLQLTPEDNLEQALLARVAALDPKLAAQNAEQMMEKGQFPRTLPEVINRLRGQDAEAAEKLADKAVKRIQSANLLTNSEAGMLVQALLTPGIRLDVEGTAPLGSARQPVLEQSVYVDLLSSVIDAALKATPTAQRGVANVRRGQVTPGQTRQPPAPAQPTEAQIEQANARRLLTGLNPVMSIIDQHLPSKASQVRQKLAEMGMTSGSTSSVPQTIASLQGNPSADALFQAASSAPPQMQSRLYQQAAYKALEEGDIEKARRIATDHLQNNAREAVMQRIGFRELTLKAEGTRLEEIRQAVARMSSDTQKIDVLIQLANDYKKTDRKLAIQLLEEAKQITNRRATSYEHFEQQLKVARAFATVDPAQSFEMLDPGISQLNELLSAASVLSGFELSLFRDGEMSMQGGGGLTATINRYGQELALLAKTDFERSETLAGRFQFSEPRIMARMSIVKGLLSTEPAGSNTSGSQVRREFIRQD